MTLNIYEISHPIIQVIVSNINQHNIEHSYKCIGLLFLYEILRKNIQTDKIYIKHIHKIKNLNVIKKDNNYIMLTNISDTFDIISDIKIILPSIKIININYTNKKNIHDSLKNLKINLEKSKIFIIEKTIKNTEIIELIRYLNEEKQIKNRNIKIGCIITNEDVLKKIGSKYSDLQLYTTKIIYN